jgi:N-hydroxyarylamine O-acetyltransferase
MVDVHAYVSRIGYDGPLEPADETLIALHRAHMLAAPFENLDLHLGGRNVLGQQAAYRKVVELRRGGWCFELNGAFAALLEALGFEVTLMGARVHSATGDPPDDNHLCLRVAARRVWLADVGFGDNFTRPILFEERGDQERDGRMFRLVDDGQRVTLTEDGVRRYSFSPEPRAIDHFGPENERLQTDPGSHFVQNRICSLATERGRVSLSGLRLIETVDGQRSERELAGDAEWLGVLGERFGIEPVVRHAARALVVDDAQRVLLVRFSNPDTGAVWWATPGGAVDSGETHEQAVRRELREETGLQLDALGPWVWAREHLLVWAGVFTHQVERYFLIRTPAFDARPSALTEEERSVLTELRWWTLDELERSDQVFTPRDLSGLLRRLIAEGPPAQPQTVGL